MSRARPRSTARPSTSPSTTRENDFTRTSSSPPSAAPSAASQRLPYDFLPSARDSRGPQSRTCSPRHRARLRLHRPRGCWRASSGDAHRPRARPPDPPAGPGVVAGRTAARAYVSDVAAPRIWPGRATACCAARALFAMRRVQYEPLPADVVGNHVYAAQNPPYARRSSTGSRMGARPPPSDGCAEAPQGDGTPRDRAALPADSAARRHTGSPATRARAARGRAGLNRVTGPSHVGEPWPQGAPRQRDRAASRSKDTPRRRPPPAPEDSALHRSREERRREAPLKRARTMRPRGAHARPPPSAALQAATRARSPRLDYPSP